MTESQLSLWPVAGSGETDRGFVVQGRDVSRMSSCYYTLCCVSHLEFLRIQVKDWGKCMGVGGRWREIASQIPACEMAFFRVRHFLERL